MTETAARGAAGVASYGFPQRWRISIIAISLALLIASLAVGGWQIGKSFLLHAGQFDFSAYYAAARALSLDHTANIYSPQVFAASAISGHVLAPPSLQYAYPPLLAILLIPLAHFPFAVASNMFLMLNTGLWLCCMLLIAEEVRYLLGTSLAVLPYPADASRRTLWSRLASDPAPLVAVAVSSALFFISRPAWWTLGNGQINLLVLLPLSAIPWLTRHGHERWVGVAIAIATMIKLTPIVLLGYLILRRRWQAAVAAVITVALLACACVAFISPEVFAQFPSTSLQIGGADALEAHNEALFAGIVSVIIANAPSLASVVRGCEYLLLAVLASAGGFVLWQSQRLRASRTRLSDHAAEMAGFCIALCGIVLLSPTAWAHHYVWLLPAAAITLALTLRAFAIAHTSESGRSSQRHALALLFVALVAAVFLDLPLPYGWDTDPAAHHTLLFGLALRPWLEELRPLGGLVVAVLAAGMTRMKYEPGNAPWRT